MSFVLCYFWQEIKSQVSNLILSQNSINAVSTFLNVAWQITVATSVQKKRKLPYVQLSSIQMFLFECDYCIWKQIALNMIALFFILTSNVQNWRTPCIVYSISLEIFLSLGKPNYQYQQISFWIIGYLYQLRNLTISASLESVVSAEMKNKWLAQSRSVQSCFQKFTFPQSLAPTLKPTLLFNF